MANIKWCLESVKEYLNRYGYELLSTEYTRTRDKLKMKCPEGHIIERRFDHFKRDHSCPKCSGNAKHTLDEVKQYIIDYGYILLSTEYKNNKTKLKMQCPKGHIFEMRFNEFKVGQRCPKCKAIDLGDRLRYSYEYVKEYIDNEGYELLSTEYKNSKEDKLKIKCPKGHIFEMRFGNFNQGQRCSVCKSSKGEIKIQEFLQSNNIEFISEYTFEDCKYKRVLPFDFYIPKLNICIEYDGKQHFERINFFDNTLEKFNERLHKDQIKTEYCKENNIKLIRISYQDYENINSILIKELNL